MKVCPNVNTPEWKFLLDTIGEHEAYRIFISSGYTIPTMEELVSIVEDYKTTSKASVDIETAKQRLSERDTELTHLGDLLQEAVDNDDFQAIDNIKELIGKYENVKDYNENALLDQISESQKIIEKSYSISQLRKDMIASKAFSGNRVKTLFYGEALKFVNNTNKKFPGLMKLLESKNKITDKGGRIHYVHIDNYYDFTNVQSKLFSLKKENASEKKED